MSSQRLKLDLRPVTRRELADVCREVVQGRREVAYIGNWAIYPSDAKRILGVMEPNPVQNFKNRQMI